MNRVRVWQAFLYPLGLVTVLTIAGFTCWVLYAAGSVWLARLRE